MDQQSELSQVHNNSSHDSHTASKNWNNGKNPSALTKWPGIDKRATGGLNEKGTKPQTSVSLWNQRKHSGYKLKKKEKGKKKNDDKKQL